VDFLRFLYGIEDWHRSRRLKDIVAVSALELNKVLKRLASELNGGSYPAETRPVIIARKAEAENAAAKLGAEIFELPV
jgi:hypothetical protein